MENQTQDSVNTNTEININQLLEFCTVLNFDKMEENSVVVLRIKDVTPPLIRALQMISEKYFDDFRRKNITLMLLNKDDSIETMNERQMEKFGWVKKEQSRIITLS